jgi:hypothetical protein
MRIVSQILFAAAIVTTLLMNVLAVPEVYITVSVTSVIVMALITHLMWIRLTGLIGICGLSLVYSILGSDYPAAKILVFLAGLLSVSGVVMMLFADLSFAKKGNVSDQ